MASLTDRPRPRSSQKALRRQLRGQRLSPKQLQQRLRAARRQLVRTARAARRQIDRHHDQFPKPVHAVFEPLAPALTRPTYHRLVLLALAAILTVGGRTIANLLRFLGGLAPGHASSYHRLLSHRRWPSRRLARRSIAAVLARLAPQGPVELAGDDTVTEHPGKTVYGKGRHRDPVRSTRSFTAFRWGHKWVVLALLVRFPFCRRRWALPLMVALYRPEEPETAMTQGKEEPAQTGPAKEGPAKEGPAKTESETKHDRQKRSHKTPVDVLGQMLRILIRWFPDRTFLCSADGNYAAHELAGLAAAHPQRLKFVSKFYANANLFEPPPYIKGQSRGRPRVKGKELPKPAQVVRQTPKPSVQEVAWYGGQRRRVEVVTGSGWWYQAGRPLIPVRWVFVRDRTGTHRDEYFFTTDLTMSPQTVIETYTGRWNIETTFQEARSYLGLETTRGRSRNTVLRAEPSLLVLYTLVVLLYGELPVRYRRVRVVEWWGKSDVTFSDAITAVRRYLWVEGGFSLSGHREAFEKLGRRLRQILLQGLAPAA
jgi:DDE superfamily endonuclease/Archaeal putative transposase ISC1217